MRTIGDQLAMAGTISGQLDLTGDARHRHIPGSPMDYRHEWIPITPQAAKSHFRGHIPAGWHPPGGSSTRGDGKVNVGTHVRVTGGYHAGKEGYITSTDNGAQIQTGDGTKILTGLDYVEPTGKPDKVPEPEAHTVKPPPMKPGVRTGPSSGRPSGGMQAALQRLNENPGTHSTAAKTSHDVDKSVADIESGRIGVRYRASSAIGHVVPPTSEGNRYGAMSALYNDLEHGRLDPADAARFHAENFSPRTVGRQADDAEAIAQILDRTTHTDEDVKQWLPEHPAEVKRAAAGLHAYAAAARAHLASDHPQVRERAREQAADDRHEAARKADAAAAEAKRQADAAEAKRLAAERAAEKQKIREAGEANARGMEYQMAKAKAGRIHLAQNAGMTMPHPSDLRLRPGHESFLRAVDAAHEARYEDAVKLLDQAISEERGSIRGKPTKAAEKRLDKLDELRRGLNVTAIQRKAGRPDVPPGLARVRGTASGMIAVDHTGAQYEIKLNKSKGIVSVTRDGRTLSAPAGDDPTTTARRLAGQLAQPEPSTISGQLAARPAGGSQVEREQQMLRDLGKQHGLKVLEHRGPGGPDTTQIADHVAPIITHRADKPGEAVLGTGRRIKADEVGAYLQARKEHPGWHPDALMDEVRGERGGVPVRKRATA